MFGSLADFVAEGLLKFFPLGDSMSLGLGAIRASTTCRRGPMFSARTRAKITDEPRPALIEEARFLRRPERAIAATSG
jgi:hypothetical protein